MVLSKAEKQDAYREAKQIMLLGEKWQELMPGEKRPNFERAAQEILRRALGHKVQRNEEPLQLHGGLMHEHAPREARLVERFLRSGMVHPDALHSFQHDRVTLKPDPQVPAPVELPDYLPDFDLYVHNAGEDMHYPSHYEVGAQKYHSTVNMPPAAKELMPAPAGTKLPSTYEAVH